MQLEERLSRRTQRMGANAIREILKVASREEITSLAGGLPSPDSFPMHIMREMADTVFDEFGSRALQYDATEGFLPLREALIDHLKTQGVSAQLDQITVYSGSQSVLDIFSKIMITPGDRIVIEAPSYLGAISAFNAYEPEYLSVATDDNGIIPDDLERILRAGRDLKEPIKFVYLVPTFQNPTGRTLTLERRKRVAELIQEYDVLLLEDDPYSALRYSGEPVPPIHAFAPEHVIYTSTFSKTLAPGLRLGYSVAPKELARWMVIAKQGVDLHTNTLGQALAAEYLNSGHLRAHLPSILDLYRPLRDSMLRALEQYFPPGFTWSRPEGGMFVWVEGPEGLDGEKLYWKCVEQGVAFVPGKFFFIAPSATADATLRLNFTSADAATIESAVKLIAELAAEHMALPA